MGLSEYSMTEAGSPMENPTCQPMHVSDPRMLADQGESLCIHAANLPNSQQHECRYTKRLHVQVPLSLDHCFEASD